MPSQVKLPSQNQIALALIGMIILATGCGSSVGSQAQPGAMPPQSGNAPLNLTVFAAASLAEAFNQLGARFESSHPGTDLTFNFAGSQQLAQQLAQGAQADLFASANLDQMEAVIEQDRVSPGSQQVFAHNRLVVAAYPQADGVQQLQDLAKPGIVLVLAGEAVPAGKYAHEFLARAGQDRDFGPGFEEAVLKNVVSNEENVRAVLSKVVLGEADAGIVYASDAAGVPAGQIRVLDIPPGLNVEASYYIAPVSDASQPELAGAFIQFLLSAEGQQVLIDHGFQPADSP